MGVAITALALLALAWPPLGVEASRAQIEGDGARHPRREGPLGAVPSADGWEDRVPESSAGWVSDVYWRRRSRVTRASEEDVGEDQINWRALKVLHRLERSRQESSRAEATAAGAAGTAGAAIGEEDRGGVSTMGSKKHSAASKGKTEDVSSWKAWETRASDWWSNTTEEAYRYWEESGRSKTVIEVELFVDAADPYSLELILGPVQHLLRMDLGPLRWIVSPNSNVGAGERTDRVDCASIAPGDPARLGCDANAAVACVGDSLLSLTSGTRPPSSWSKGVWASLSARFKGADVTPVEEMGASGPVDMNAWEYEDFLERGGVPDEEERGEVAGGIDDVDPDAPHLVMPPAFVEELARDNSSAHNAFLQCFATGVLEAESRTGFGFAGGIGSLDAAALSESCCESAMDSIPAFMGGRNATACEMQKMCVASDRGHELLKKTSKRLNRLHPKHKWLPWVLVEGKPVCMHSCNLQKAIRRAVCELREGTLPDDCPRFPWTTIWYDEPGLSLAGIIGVCIGFCVVVSSICVLAQHAGFFDEKKKPKRPSEEEEASETDPLIPPEEKV